MIKVKFFALAVMIACVCLVSNGCRSAPGKPGPEVEAQRPDEVMDAATLYRQNCAGCHGDQGRNGAAIALSNPVYLGVAGAATIERVTGAGVPGSLMPAFAKSAGGMLTDRQIVALTEGMMRAWGKPNALAGQPAPSYASTGPGDVTRGQQAYTTFCARCHGMDGAGVAAGTVHTGSLVEPAYLALVSDQGLRSMIIAGMPEQGMPDWRSDLSGAGARSMTDQEITDTVAWLASHRTPAPGQPYREHQ